MRVLLILPFDRTYRRKGAFSTSIGYAPLTLTTLAALIPTDLHVEVDIVDEGVSPPKLDGDYDIVGITATASSSPRAWFLCAHWRARGAHVAIGGAHVTLMPEEASRHADTVFVGLAEQTCPHFLYDFTSGKPQALYRHEPLRECLPMPTPRRELLASRYMKIPTIVANRGCRLSCDFCSIQHQWGKRGLMRPVEEVVAEIRSHGAKRWIFLDPNIYSERTYSLALFEALAPLNIRWSGLSTLSVVDDNEIFEAMKRSGCEGLLLGLENLSQETMRQIGKPTNRVSEYRRQISKLRENGIASLGCFVLGFDEDTEQSIRQTIQDIPALGLDLVRFSVLTPLPGTSLHQRLVAEHRILTDDLSLYDNEHVVFQPKNMSSECLQALLHDAWRESYQVKHILYRALIRPGSRWLRLAANIGFRIYAARLRREKVALFRPEG
ncbi:radical SAM protein [Citrobacter braakii]|nr:radical SAM protein [Citrobacter braakii]MBJ8904282.1 radical SAM protein [Citrobacter braakii]MBJ8907529.1 radical SAM protein [Citrobacter braakii]MBJ8922916.1 radical SAM protein [Citrobacter braakii]